ncbi:granulocyte colony-stimulating factor-like [Brachyistius frenatus]|uniref:granulocyte colony-stimulating factor-like n=1 Tax=Brachyistius frenatus TaxID=100188 RepID=UPI0037E96B18
MDTRIAIALLHCFLFTTLVQSAPVSSPSALPPAFREAAERAKTLVEKILGDIPAVHAAAITTEGLTLSGSMQTSNLQMMVTSLGIPPAPVLKPLSERFSLDTCVQRMLAGGQLYQGLLGVLSDRLGGLKDLRADLRDLLTHITKMKEAAQLSSPDQNQILDLDPLDDTFKLQVAAHVTLTRLRSFCHDLIRSLRAAAAYRP